ncbi:hydrolase [Sphingopyxis sp. MSC1_008]|jgi:glutamate carboxypeptidase|uniref:hydrolase n=1 Tax=Sphingopyxis sp. MSC1_008 TaxID=2909265 RepID=UPI0024A7586C|nr:hydrolase [Sphingopyxis sp. MSC1_008]
MTITDISRDEAEALAWIDTLGPVLLERTLAWSAINSGSFNLAGLGHMAELIGGEMDRLGGTTSLRDPAPFAYPDARGDLQPVQHGRNLHFRRDAGGAANRVLLVGHMDTVFGVDHPFQSPDWIDDKTVRGPGVADMKGGIVVMLTAIEALLQTSLADRLGIEVIVNADEEVSSVGSEPLLAEVAQRCTVGLAYEPSATPEGVLAGARKGCANFAVAITGRAAHAGRNPHDGRNAIVAAAELAGRIAALTGARPDLTANPARIDGGGPENIVPDRAVLRFNVRLADPADQPWLLGTLNRLVDEIAARHDVGITLHGGIQRPPKPMDAHQRQLFDLVRDCGAALDLDIAWQATGGACDGNNLAAHGLAVVDTLGVRGGAIHSDREFMIVDSLVERAKLSALLLMRLARMEESFSAPRGK